MQSLGQVILYISQALQFLLIVYIILGLLIAFEVVNRRQQLVAIIFNSLDQIFTPILDPIRRILPPTGGLDFSPIIVFIGLYAIDTIVINNLIR